MISFCSNNEEEKEFILFFNLKDSNAEENNSLITFPLNETINSRSINFDNFDNSSYYNIFKSIFEKEKELPKKNKSELQFLIIKETPPVLLTKDITNLLRNKIDNWDEIKNILNNKSYLNNNAIKKVENQLIKKESSKNKKLDKKIDNSVKMKLGRKTINDETIRNHNKYSPDNIINKIKTILKKYIIIFINNVINCIYTLKQRNIIMSELSFPIYKTSDLIKDIDYKSTASKKKKLENLLLLNFSLKQFLSFDLSRKFKIITQQTDNISKFNQKIMTEYLFKDDSNWAIFNFVLKELKLEDFLDIFVHKKELSDFPLFNSLNFQEKKIIEKSLVRIEKYLNELLKEKDNIYLICFLLLIYNFRRYFSIKNGRNRQKDEIYY